MSFTVVTAFFDIGRNEWKTKHRRPDKVYFKNIKNMMGLDVKMVVFTEPKNVQRFSEFRQGKEDRTNIIEMEFCDLEMYPYMDQMKKCQNDSKIMTEHPDHTCPEYLYPKYNALVNSKFGILRRAVELNPFNTEFFCWIDAGYTHSTIDLTGMKYEPTILYNYPHTITLSQLYSIKYMDQGYTSFFLQHIDIVSAGFFFGKGDTIMKFQGIYHSFYKKILFEYGISDDEQYYLALLLREQPHLFNPIFMDWFGSLKLK